MNTSGYPYNKTFQAISTGSEPYYYISAQLDLTGLYTGGPSSSNPYIVYFNQENNYNYLDTSLYSDPDNYRGFYPIDDNSIIGEVVVYANPDLEYSGLLNNVGFIVGGAYKPSIALDTSPVNAFERQSLDVWGGPTGNTPGVINASEIEDAQDCRYGREPEYPITSEVYNPEWGTRKFLALKYILLDEPTSEASERLTKKKVKLIKQKARNRVIRPQIIYGRPRPRAFRQLPGEDEFLSGKIYVVVKIYPKFEV
jgi:hypothetical protein